MTTEANNTEYHIISLLEKLDALRGEHPLFVGGSKLISPMRAEVRSLEFWRSIISECLASFFYVFIICGAAAGSGVGASIPSVLLATSLSSGFAMAMLNQCFAHISGAHVNPAVTVAMTVTKNITPLRGAMFIVAQCGGSIAGSAFLYGVSIPGYQGNLAAAVAHSASVAAWERFAVEFMLTFIVVFTHFVSMDPVRKMPTGPAFTIGASYAACSFVSMPYLNPARSLGPSFVLNKWESHWVYWFGPILGGIFSGLVYELIFNQKKQAKRNNHSIDGDSSSLRSEEDTYDDLEKSAQRFHQQGSVFNTYRSAAGAPVGALDLCPSTAGLYCGPGAKLDRVESLYGGTKSLYCKSPPMSRAGLHRSQSVCVKSNCTLNKELPRPGTLAPAQSLYPMCGIGQQQQQQHQQQTHAQNQNVHNQTYGNRAQNSGRHHQLQESGTSASDYPLNDSKYHSQPAEKYHAQPSDKYHDTKYHSQPPEKYHSPAQGGEPTGRYHHAPATESSSNKYQLSSGHGVYGTRSNPSPGDNCKYEPPTSELKNNVGVVGSGKLPQRESLYGGAVPKRMPPIHGEEASAYPSYKGQQQQQQHQQQQQQQQQQQGFGGRIPCGGAETRHSPPTQLLMTSSGTSASYHHSRMQHSPNPQY